MSKIWKILAISVVAGVASLAALAAKAPEELLKPDGRTADMSRPVQVFILLGQSNMVGAGKVGPEDKEGTLLHAVKNENLYPFLTDVAGQWAERKDVRYVRVMGSGTGARMDYFAPMRSCLLSGSMSGSSCRKT